MTTEELIQFASAARLPTGWQAGFAYYISEELRRFAELVAANEREECARVCDAVTEKYDEWVCPEQSAVSEECAAAIRARTK